MNKNTHSSKVLLKCLGRAFGFCGIKASAISASTSKLLTSEWWTAVTDECDVETFRVEWEEWEYESGL